MIDIKVDLKKWGFEDLRENLGFLEIINTGTGTKTKGNYKFKFYSKNMKKVIHQGTIEGFPRTKDSVWKLIKLCLDKRYRG